METFKREWLDSIDNEIAELEESIKILEKNQTGIHGYSSDIERLQKQIYALEEEVDEEDEEEED